MACVGLYGALFAQNMKNESGFVLKDNELKSIYKTFVDQLKNAECRLISADTIACGSAMLKLSFIFAKRINLSPPLLLLLLYIILVTDTL